MTDQERSEESGWPTVCPSCKSGDHVWSMLGECRCWACYCTASRLAAVPSTGEQDR